MLQSVAGICKVDNKFLLGKRKEGGSIGGKWEFPGGKVEKDETYENSLIREYDEELGVQIVVKDFIVKCEFSSNDHNFSLYAYYIELCNQNISYNEHDEFRYFTLEEIYTLNDDFADSDKLLLEFL